MQPDYVRRRADITLYWASVTVPFQNFPLAALDTNSTGQMYPHNELFDLAHEDVYPNHSLYQILACCVHFMDNIDSPVSIFLRTNVGLSLRPFIYQLIWLFLRSDNYVKLKHIPALARNSGAITQHPRSKIRHDARVHPEVDGSDYADRLP